MFIESMHFADGDADVLFEAVVLLHIAEALAWLALCVVHGLAAFAGGLAFFALQAARAGLAWDALSAAAARAWRAAETPAARNPPAPTYTRYDASHMNSAAAAAAGGDSTKSAQTSTDDRCRSTKMVPAAATKRAGMPHKAPPVAYIAVVMPA